MMAPNRRKPQSATRPGHSIDDGHFTIVTGAGRSGTSAVARILHESGLLLGRDFAPPSEFNPVGFYEELPVCELNQSIMAACGTLELQEWPAPALMVSRSAAYGEQMEKLITATSADGWKDPRFCFTLETWLPHFPAPPRVVVCLRSPEAFVHSTINSFGLLPREKLERWWVNHYRRILDVIRSYQLDATCVVYEELVRQPAEALARLSSFVRRPLNAKYLEPALQHFAYQVPRCYAALYDEVKALSNG